MRQLLQNYGTGEISIADVPAPRAGDGEVLISNRASVVSAGTERMLLEFGRAGWVEKARSQPEKVREVIDKARTDGLRPTIEAVRSKLDTPVPMGYSSAGIVLEVGRGVAGLEPGDSVASNGAHAEVVSVPRNLCAPVPEGLGFEKAAYTVIGAIALQGVRLADPSIGETVVVSGLGLVGLLTVQILSANGCRVVGVDLKADRLELAERFGATAVVDLSKGEEPVERVLDATSGRGADAVVIAAATESSEPVRQAARMSRARGRVVLVGVTGLELDRNEFYEKELTFQVSRSYGPGRHDPAYEEKGHDYPPGYVRWTEGRNFEAMLDLMAGGRVDPQPLTTHRYPLDQADEAYEAVLEGEEALGVVLEYPALSGEETPARRIVLDDVRREPGGGPRAAVIGAGNFADRVLVPAIESAGARLVEVVSAGGTSAARLASRYGFERCSTDPSGAIAADDVDTLFVATPHDTHAELAVAALAAGKSLYLEKPLATTLPGVEDVRRTYREVAQSVRAPLLMLGFNRRFAPLIDEVRASMERRAGLAAFVYTVNAGAVPPDHWIQDPEIGGGRIVGEACHMVDLLRFLAGAPIESWHAVRFGADDGSGALDDKATIVLRFADGSHGTVHYLANGHRSFPKERLEVFQRGRILVVDNFVRLERYGDAGGGRGWRLPWRGGQDKGHEACVAAFVRALREGGPSPIPPEEIFEVSEVVARVAEDLRREGTSDGRL